VFECRWLCDWKVIHPVKSDAVEISKVFQCRPGLLTFNYSKKFIWLNIRNSEVTEGLLTGLHLLKSCQLLHSCTKPHFARPVIGAWLWKVIYGSSEIMQFDRPFITFCQWSIVTTLLSCAVSEILLPSCCMWLSVTLRSPWDPKWQLKLQVSYALLLTYKRIVINMVPFDRPHMIDCIFVFLYNYVSVLYPCTILKILSLICWNLRKSLLTVHWLWRYDRWYKNYKMGYFGIVRSHSRLLEILVAFVQYYTIS